MARGAASEFGDALPAVGDECVLMGSTSDPQRQGLILISATDDGQPRIDVMNGVSGKTLAGCLHARMGNLDGIADSWFPADDQPHGYGLYADNAYLRGRFLLTTGEVRGDGGHDPFERRIDAQRFHDGPELPE